MLALKIVVALLAIVGFVLSVLLWAGVTPPIHKNTSHPSSSAQQPEISDCMFMCPHNNLHPLCVKACIQYASAPDH